ncbi:type IV pilus biogenesis protein PilM [Yersinia massiliensis]|uniref:Pilus assembly protein PilM n=1 Tax=Yersinia massiliensis TaxID=419257 RepID=A0ABM6V0H9_9GAMM|nr:type IV pilus biogenesis protein PilM [Yersinia massiliensis]AVX40717.1 pilus assembly protein PilM [Yersinia massiliensis]
MLGTNTIMVILFLFIGAIGYSAVNESNRQASIIASDQGAATTFFLYVEQLDKYLSANPTFTGSITTQIEFPTWLSKNNNINMYAENGRGYVYMSAKSNVYDSLVSRTENSSMIGLTDSNSIITNLGPIPKPSVIPQNYIVYMI